MKMKINIHYYGSKTIFRRIAHNRNYIQTYCNDRRNTFDFACRQWFLYNNPGVLT